MISRMGGTNIQVLWASCKRVADEAIGEWGIFAVVILMALGSFGLGRLSALEGARPLVSVTEAATSQGMPTLALGGQFVAARSGTVYYYPWCAGAAKIAVQNQVWFASEQAAQKAGYTAAKNCKGLQ